MQMTFEMPGGLDPALLFSRGSIKGSDLPSMYPLMLDDLAVSGRQGELDRDRESCEDMIERIESLRGSILSPC